MPEPATPDAPRGSRRLRLALILGTGLVVGAGAVTVFWVKYRQPELDAPKIRRGYARAVVTKVPEVPANTSPATAPAERAARPAEVGSESEDTRECLECTTRGIAEHLVEQSKADFPELSAILLSETPQREGTYASLMRLLEAAKNASDERRPTLLLTADMVATRVDLPKVHPPNDETRRKLDELTSYGLTFRWSELGGDYFSDRALLWRVWKEYPATPGGEDAFALLLDSGWDTSACCGNGSDAFRNVIREAERFLAERPNSARRLDVEFAAAEAYETWWSLSRAPARRTSEEEPAPDAYREGAELARGKAITYYEEIARTAPESVQVKCSHRSLEMLKENRDTHQRRFFCLCD